MEQRGLAEPRPFELGRLGVERHPELGPLEHLALGVGDLRELVRIALAVVVLEDQVLAGEGQAALRRALFGRDAVDARHAPHLGGEILPRLQRSVGLAGDAQILDGPEPQIGRHLGAAVGRVVGAVVEIRHLDEEVLAVRVLANDEVVAHTILQTGQRSPMIAAPNLEPARRDGQDGKRGAAVPSTAPASRRTFSRRPQRAMAARSPLR